MVVRLRNNRVRKRKGEKKMKNINLGIIKGQVTKRKVMPPPTRYIPDTHKAKLEKIRSREID